MNPTRLTRVLLIVLVLGAFPIGTVKADHAPTLKVVPMLSTGVSGPGDIFRASVTVVNPGSLAVAINGYDVSLQFNLAGDMLSMTGITDSSLREGTIYQGREGMILTVQVGLGKLRHAGVILGDPVSISGGGSAVLYHVDYQVVDQPAAEMDKIVVPSTVPPEETILATPKVVLGDLEYHLDTSTPGLYLVPPFIETDFTQPPGTPAGPAPGNNPRAVPKHLDVSKGGFTVMFKADITVQAHSNPALVRIVYVIVSVASAQQFVVMTELRLDPSSTATQMTVETSFTVEGIPTVYHATAKILSGSIVVDPVTGLEKSIQKETDSRTLSFRVSL